jgi:hypothetical protein
MNKIMGLFSGGDDYVDYTLLQKKGLLQAEQGASKDVSDFSNQRASQSPDALLNSDGYMNFGSNATSDNETGVANPFAGSNETSSASNESADPLAGFFGGVSNEVPTSSSESVSSGYFGSADSNETSSASSMDNSSEVSALKIKIEDMEYKLERALERIDSFENK